MERDRAHRWIWRLKAHTRPRSARIDFKSHINHHLSHPETRSLLSEQQGGEITCLDKVVPLHRRTTLLRALVRTKDLRQESGALPVQILEPRAEIPPLFCLLFILLRRLFLATEARKETPLSVLLLDWRKGKRVRALLNLDFLLCQILRL